jgi:hypothetical protein
MEADSNSGYLSGLSMLSLIVGTGFLSVCLILWWFMRQRALILFGGAMFFGGVANCLACHVLQRMDAAGYEVGYWRWLPKDLRLYSEYWRIAPSRGRSRFVLAGSILCFLLAGMFLLSIAVFAGYPIPR